MAGTGVTFSSNVARSCLTACLKWHLIQCILLVRLEGGIYHSPLKVHRQGYAGYYGLSLIVGSYPVLFVSLAAHAAQFAFLVFFENPRGSSIPIRILQISNAMVLDIERMYGQRKPIAQRTPLIIPQPTTRTTYLTYSRPRSLDSPLYVDSPTPTVTEGETTETETELDTELDESYMLPPSDHARIAEARPRSHSLTQHDLLNFFFRKDVIILRNIDLLRYAFAMSTYNFAHACPFSLFIHSVLPMSSLYFFWAM